MGFWTVQRLHAGTGITLAAAIGAAAVAGAFVAAIHAFLVITLRASQIVSGLALTIFAGAAGLSSYLGNDFNLADNPARHEFHAVFPSSFQRWPVVGPIVFGQNVLVYASWACVAAVSLYLSRTRAGLNVRAVGESPAAADAMGIKVVAYRYAHTLAGVDAQRHAVEQRPVGELFVNCFERKNVHSAYCTRSDRLPGNDFRL